MYTTKGGRRGGSDGNLAMRDDLPLGVEGVEGGSKLEFFLVGEEVGVAVGVMGFESEYVQTIFFLEVKISSRTSLRFPDKMNINNDDQIK